MHTFSAAVTLFLRPNGQQSHAITELPIEHLPAYLDMQLHGCRFESKVLQTEVSVTISDGEQDLDIRVVGSCKEENQEIARFRALLPHEESNGLDDGYGLAVQVAMVELLKGKLWLDPKLPAECP